MQCIKIVYINTMMIFVINKYSIEGGVGGGGGVGLQEEEGAWFCL